MMTFAPVNKLPAQAQQADPAVADRRAPGAATLSGLELSCRPL
ncbi:MAG: hypothetical protein RLZZ09_853, partial [Pseudomonadota bacterium]